MGAVNPDKLPGNRFKEGGTVKDDCYRKAKETYKVFPSAYASGSIAKCRKAKSRGRS
jgi:hypothetical protein